MKSKSPPTKSEKSKQAWCESWLDDVANGASTMSQRKLTSIESLAKKRARARGAHLLLLTDDRGDQLVAASRHRFQTLC